MFSLLKKEQAYQQEARAAYARIMEQVRKASFYDRFGVPDTFDGRFELLLVHLFMVVHVLAERGADGKAFNQALFDAAFTDMDQTLRQMGAGDMSVPKHMRRMMKAFNGRMHAYEAALEDDAGLDEALARNLYGTLDAPDSTNLAGMRGYMRAQIAALRQQNPADILAGNPVFQEAAND